MDFVSQTSAMGCAVRSAFSRRNRIGARQREGREVRLLLRGPRRPDQESKLNEGASIRIGSPRRELITAAADCLGRKPSSHGRNRRRQLKHVASFRETNEAKLARCEINRLTALASLCWGIARARNADQLHRK